MTPQIATAAEQPSADAEVGRRIHMLMWDRQISQTALAPYLGMEQSALSKKLRGSRGWSIGELLTVATRLETTVAYLVGETDEVGRDWCTPRDLNPEPTDYEVRGTAPIISLADARAARTADAKVAS